MPLLALLIKQPKPASSQARLSKDPGLGSFFPQDLRV